MEASTQISPPDPGPWGYANWKAFIDGEPEQHVQEYELYSDATFTGEISGGSPYTVINLVSRPVPEGLIHPALTLRAAFHLDSGTVKAELDKGFEAGKTDVSRFHGGRLPDEIASLLSLALGTRLRAGPLTRQFTPTGDPRGRPVGWDTWRLPPLSLTAHNSVLPGVPTTVALQSNLFVTYPTLASDDALAVVRAARSFQEAIWSADDDANLAWLLLVSAVETAASQWYRGQQSAGARDLLSQLKPEFVARVLDAGGEKAAQVVAEELAGTLKATAKFLDFMKQFMPAPPAPHPPTWAALDWAGAASMRTTMRKVYEHRSKALHESVPFPLPMCEIPMRHGGAEGISESWSQKPGGVFTHVRSGFWAAEDVPILLNTFEYIVRHALQSWWRSLSERQSGTPAKRPH
jgi:hypothetical protein